MNLWKNGTDQLTCFPVENAVAPAMIVCPGGGYGKLADHEGEPVAKYLNSIGIAAFVLRYRISPNRHPLPLADAQRAVRFIRFHADEFGIHPSRIGILGFSAGGHLAASAATLYDLNCYPPCEEIDNCSARPDLLVACYPVITFGEFRHNGSMKNLLGKNPDPALRKLLSLENAVTAETPPTFLWHSADDGSVPVENSLLLASALKKKKVPFALHIFPHGRHGLGLAENTLGCSHWPQLLSKQLFDWKWLGA